MISTPSNDGLGVMLGNSNIVFYNAPRSFLEILDAVTMKPGEESDLFLNLAFNKNDLLSNTNEIDRLFPTVEELQAIYQDLKDVLPASEKDVKRALGFEDGISRVYLSMLEDMGLVAYDADIWHIVKNKELSRDSVVKTLRYREGIAEKRMARWFASRLSTTTTRALLRSLMNGGEVLKIG